MAVTWNPLDVGSAVILSNGNLTLNSPTGSTNGNARANIGISSGKYYWEIHHDSGLYPAIGIANGNADLSGFGAFSGNVARIYVNNDGKLYPGGISYGSTYDIGDTIGVALDMDSATGILKFFKNGISQGVAFSDIKSTLGNIIYPFQTYAASNSCTITANFGATPFAYPIPDGYTALDGGTPPAINTSITSIIASATSQALIPVITIENGLSVNINGVVASAINQTINPIINAIRNISIQSLITSCTSNFNIPSVSAIENEIVRNEIVRMELLEKIRKPIIKIEDRDIINSEQTRNIRIEVI